MPAKEKARAAVRVADREIIITRTFNAPRELVFKAWTEPRHLVKWWGPKDFTNPICEADARPGGAMRIHMCAPDGKIYPIKGTYHEVVAPERIVYTDEADIGHDWIDGLPPPTCLVTVTFEDKGGKTKLTIHMLFDTVEDRDATLKMGVEGGFAESFERLDALLNKL
jgi:uncharacterized protein YndB with AHSA1/START domain